MQSLDASCNLYFNANFPLPFLTDKPHIALDPSNHFIIDRRKYGIKNVQSLHFNCIINLLHVRKCSMSKIYTYFMFCSQKKGEKARRTIIFYALFQFLDPSLPPTLWHLRNNLNLELVDCKKQEMLLSRHV